MQSICWRAAYVVPGSSLSTLYSSCFTLLLGKHADNLVPDGELSPRNCCMNTVKKACEAHTRTPPPSRLDKPLTQIDATLTQRGLKLLLGSRKRIVSLKLCRTSSSIRRQPSPPLRQHGQQEH
jgi:hypothetical protein